MSTKTRLDSLTGLRALAAAWVVLLHFREPILALAPGGDHWQPLVLSGYLGVDVFFILSGFVISYNYLDRLAQFSWKGTKTFLGLRIARIYPVHLVMLLVTGVLVAGASAIGMVVNSEANYTLRNFVMNVFLLQTVPPNDPWNPPSWSITVEFGAYLAFPALALVLGRIRTSRWAFALAAATVVVAGLVFRDVAAEPNLPGYTFAWLRIAFEFLVGCLLYVGWRKLGNRAHGAWWDWCAIFGAVAVVASIALVDINEVMFVPELTVAGIALFVLGCAGAIGPIHRFFSSRIMVWGGQISYSVYMTHFLIATVLGKLVDWEQLADENWALRLLILSACMGLVVAVGAACYWIVEEPGRKYLRRRVEKPTTSERGR